MSYSEDLFCVVSKDDEAIDREKCPKEKFMFETLDGKILFREGLKYERTRNLNDLVFLPNKQPIKFYLRYWTHNEFHFLTQFKKDVGSFLYLSFIRGVVKIENLKQEDGNIIDVLKPASQSFCDQEMNEYLPGFFAEVQEIGEVAYKHNFLRRKIEKDYAAPLI